MEDFIIDWIDWLIPAMIIIICMIMIIIRRRKDRKMLEMALRGLGRCYQTMIENSWWDPEVAKHASEARAIFEDAADKIAAGKKD